MRKHFILAAALLLMTLVVYQPALEGGFLWDDDAYVSENPTLRSTAGLWRIWFEPTSLPQYYPLTHTSYWVEYRLWGLSTLGYHLTNVFLHALGAILLWRVLLLLEVPGAWLAAAIFAIHPVHAESVAWITERKNVLSGVLYLAAALAYLRWTLRDTRRRGWGPYALALVFFFLALMSKTVAASLPAALLLGLWWKRGHVELRDLLALLPFAAIGLALGGLTAWLEKVHVGATGADWHLTVVDRGLIAGRALWFYAGKLVWPADLTFIYPRWRIDSMDARQYAYPLAAFVVIVALWASRARIGLGPLVAVLFFAGTLVPALGFFDVYPMTFSFVADHFQYLASIGLITLAAAVAVSLARRLGLERSPLLQSLAVLLLLALGFQTWRQSHAYVDAETLWRDTLEKDRASPMAHTSLGAVLEERGEIEIATEHYRNALATNPSFAYAHLNLGLALARQRDLDEAILHLREALRLRPDATPAYPALAYALFHRGQPDEAEPWFQKAIQNDDDPKLRVALADILIRKGDLDGASVQLRRVLSRNPDDALAHFYTADLLAREGDRDAAIEHFRKVVRLDPALAPRAQDALRQLESGAKTSPPAPGG